MIKVKFFAVLRERLGTSEMALEPTGIHTVEDIIKTLKQQSEKHQKELERYQLLCAVNKDMLPLSASVKAGDEVALFPPVTGG